MAAQAQTHPAQKAAFSPVLYRQISTGSFLGLAAGFAVGKFSKSIGLVVGSLLLLIEVSILEITVTAED